MAGDDFMAGDDIMPLPSSQIRLQFYQEPHARDLEPPNYATAGAAGFDLRASLDVPRVWLQAGERVLIKTGIRVAVPIGWALQICPRSGLALKYGITIVNAPGIIDSDYRGEIGVILLNTGFAGFNILRGDRIAQAVLVRCEQVAFELVESLDETTRGAGGFGSSGIF